MVIAWTVFQSFVTMRFASADGNSMDHFLIFSVTMRSALADGDSVDRFPVFCHHEVYLSRWY